MKKKSNHSNEDTSNLTLASKENSFCNEKSTRKQLKEDKDAHHKRKYSSCHSQTKKEKEIKNKYIYFHFR